MEVALVSVGDEILAGDITDTNAAWLARRLAAVGVTVRRMVTLPDEVEEIATTVGELADRFDAVLVTGGLGPTHDDVTLDGVAAALRREMIEDPDAVAYFESGDYGDYAERGERATFLPDGARLLPNEAGVAPGAVVENVYVFPGVPAEMEAMFEAVVDEFGGERRHATVVHADEPESALVGRMNDLRDRFDVAVGSYPGDGVRIKVHGTDPEEVAAAVDWLRERVDYR
jgi:molybdenum cofactor synthesis domain-containing protein